MKRDPSAESHTAFGIAVALAAHTAGADPLLSGLIAVGAGLAVEAIQKAVPALGAAEKRDAAFTALGAGLGAGWAWVAPMIIAS